jgi:hypothetical protein
VIYDLPCPSNQEDSVASTVRILVVVTDAEKYYFVPNLSHAAPARHILETVRVTGDVQEEFDSIYADKLEVWQDDGWYETWNYRDEAEMRRHQRDIEDKLRKSPPQQISAH